MAKAVIRKPKKKVCQFCKEKATGVDYKDATLLRVLDVAGATGDPSLPLWYVTKLQIDAAGNVTFEPVQQFTL